MDFDIFISHASEDKEDIVRPLADQLRQRGLRVWLDETEIKLGDSLRRSIDHGLSRSRYGLVILSPSFLKKEWPQKELDGLVAREDGTEKVILPIWHNVTRAEIAAYSPTLADKLAAPTLKGLRYVVDEVIRAVTSIDSGPHNDSYQHASGQTRSKDFPSLIVEMLDRVMELADSGHPFVTGIPTGFYDLDSLTAGFQSESLIIVAGRPSSGKTAFALNVADHVACNERLPVLIFSPGDSATQVTNRIVCASSKIEPSHLRVVALSDEEWPSLVEAAERLRHASIHIHDASDLHVENVESECRRLVELHGGLGLVIIDSLQLLERGKSLEYDLSKICRRLKNLARELKSPIVVISNLPREVDLRVDKRPKLSDLGEFGEIDRHADLVLFIYRDEMYRWESAENGIAEVIVAKQRDGCPTGTVKLGFRKRIGKFENLAPTAENAVEDKSNWTNE